MPEEQPNNYQAASRAAIEAIEADVHAAISAVEGGSQSATTDTATVDNNQTESPDTTTHQEDAFIPDDVTQREDGVLEYAIESPNDADPSKPYKSVYTGKDMAELWSNIRKGLSEKDKTIAKLQQTKKQESTKETFSDVGLEKTVQAPDKEAIFGSTIQLADKAMKKEGLGSDMFDWTDEQWDEYQAEHNLKDYRVMEIRNRVREYRSDVYKYANEQYHTQNRDFINHEHVKEEAEAAALVIEMAGVDLDEFRPTLRKIINDVVASEGSRNKSGLLKSGVIVAAVQKELNGRSESVIRKKLREEFEKEIADSDKRKLRIKTPGSGGGLKTTSTSTPSYKGYQDPNLRKAFLELK